ncbi:MAG: DNA polymerase III subunit gamma/tau [Phycisphaerales bacterium]
MSYTVLARRYRSTSFDELIGQQAIAHTLRRAIESNRVAHAYLFVGTRGVGKTSMARVFAKALNGGSPEVDQAIMTGQDTDVIEIDAASNSSVDEARELIANCIYRPMRGKYKVYIIDEVHMLSTSAFNALLKTLEEPPEHVKFILCTTETHKVPATIQSRCQRFDFRNLPPAEIAPHLRHVVQSEDADADEDLLIAIARLGNGSMRDALSLLDRVMAAAEPGKTMDVALLERLLGLPRRQAIADLLTAIADADAAKAVQLADQLVQQGISREQIIESIAERLRDLLILLTCGPQTTLVELSGNQRDDAIQQASRFDAPAITHLIAVCESCSRMIAQTVMPRALFDAMIVRLAMADHVADVTRLLAEQSGSNAARPSTPAPPRSTAKKA